MINFKYVKVQGFGSILQKTKYELNHKGLNILTGENGAGKTSIFSAFTWCLYGQTLKKGSDMRPWESVKDENYTGTVVMVEFESNGKCYEVIRCDNYTDQILGRLGRDRLILIVDGEERTDLRNKKDVQEEVTRLLGMSFDLLKSSVVFGQKLKRIIEEDGPVKKKIFDEAFEVGYIGIAKKNAEKERDSLQSEVTNLIVEITGQQRISETLKTELERTLKLKEEFTTKKEKRLAELSGEIKNAKVNIITAKDAGLFAENLTIPILKIKDKLEKLSRKQNLKAELERDIFKWEMELSGKEGELQTLENAIKAGNEEALTVPTHCKTCGSRLDKESVKTTKDNILSKIRTYKNHIPGLVAEVEELKGNLMGHGGQLSSINFSINKVNIYKDKLAKLEREKNDYLSDYKRLDGYRKEKEKWQIAYREEEESTFNANIPHIKSQLLQTEQKIDELNVTLKKRKRRLEAYTWVIKDPLSNSGLKAFIFNTMLELVNIKLQYYSQFTNMDITFKIDLETANKDFYILVSKGGEERNYLDLSGGQQQMVNVCIAFAIHDVIGIEKGCNILLLDEVFESLSQGNIELVSEIIQEKSKDKCIHIITHLNSYCPPNAHITNIELTSKGRSKIFTT